MSTNRVPAVVLGGGLTALGVTRCLGRRDIPVFNLSGGAEPLVWSRWYRPLAVEEDPRLDRDPDLLETRLRDTVPGGAVLFPCSDSYAEAVAALTGGGAGDYRGFMPPARVVRQFVDKSSLADLAERAEVPHPSTLTVESESELAELDAEHFRGALLKPIFSQLFFRRFGKKSVLVHSKSEAMEAYRTYFGETGFGVVLQTFVPGPASAHLFLDGYRLRAGRTAAMLARRRERMYPPTNGNSTSMVTVSPDAVKQPARDLDRLLDLAGFHGIFSAEFKRQHERPTYQLIEVNVRPWWFVEFTARCGVDVCHLAYCDALGESVEEIDGYDVGRRCVHSYYDVHAGIEELRRGDLSIREWLGSWIGADRPVFALDDPKPGVRQALGRIGGFILRRLRRLFPFRDSP